MTIAKNNSVQESSLQVNIATQSWEKQAVYKLRYEIYVQEMAKPLGAIVNKRKQISDALDDQSILIYVQDGSEIVATMRLTIATAKNYPADLVEVFQMHKCQTLFDNQPQPIFGLGTKLAVKAEYRNTAATYLIIAEGYRLLREHNVQICFTGCNPYLIPLYERLGFRKFLGNFTDPGYGLLVSLIMIVEDERHFKAVKSPLYRYLRKCANSPTIARQFMQAFPEALNHLNTHMTTPKDLWQYAERKLARPLDTLPSFQGLNAEEILALLPLGVTFTCAAGDRIFRQGSICNDFYLLLSGTLVAESMQGHRILKPGEYFGELMRAAEPWQNPSVDAFTCSELLVIPRQAFERYHRQYPRAATVLLNNLKSIQCEDVISEASRRGGKCHE